MSTTGRYALGPEPGTSWAYDPTNIPLFLDLLIRYVSDKIL